MHPPLVSVRLVLLWNAIVCFQPAILLIGKVWVPVMHFVRVPYAEKCIGGGQEARIVQIDLNDFSVDL